MHTSTIGLRCSNQRSYRERNSVFVNDAGTFRDVSDGAGICRSRRPIAARPSLIFNGDGRIDAVVSSLGGRAELWENVSPEPSHWLILRLQGTKSNLDGMIGAKVRIGKQYNEMTTTTGYASSSAWGVHFGLGGAALVKSIEISVAERRQAGAYRREGRPRTAGNEP